MIKLNEGLSDRARAFWRVIAVLLLGGALGFGAVKPVIAADSSVVCDGVSGTYLNRNTTTFFYNMAYFSVDFWLRTDTPSQSEKGIISYGPSPTSDSPQFILQRNGQAWRYYNGASYTTSSIGTMTANQWHHVYFARNNETNMTYFGMDGDVEAVSDTNDFTGNGTANVYLCSGYGSPYKGEIDEFRLSQSIRWTADFIPPSAPYTTDGDTRALYHFDEGSGTTANDSQTNNYHLTLNNATWGGGYYVSATPTPTPSPSPTPTPTLAPTPTATPSGSFTIPPDPGKCSAWYDHDSDGSVGAEGNGVWYVRNNIPTEITRVELYGHFCDPTDGTPCGTGAYSVQGGITVPDYGSDFPDYVTYETAGFNMGDIAGFYTDTWIDYAVCTFSGGEVSTATTPFGYTMNDPQWSTASAQWLGAEQKCTNLAFTVPVINWSFEFPNWGCIIVKGIKDFFVALFAIDVTVSQDQLEEIKIAMDEKAPFAYINAVLGMDTSDPSTSTSAPTINFGLANNGGGLLQDTYEITPEAPLQAMLNLTRPALTILCWLMFVAYIFFLPRRVIK